MNYEVVELSRSGKTISVISGMGKNKGTWNTCHSRSAAYKNAKALRQEHPERVFKVVRQFG
jgi:hypothetical protein